MKNILEAWLKNKKQRMRKQANTKAKTDILKCNIQKQWDTDNSNDYDDGVVFDDTDWHNTFVKSILGKWENTLSQHNFDNSVLISNWDNFMIESMKYSKQNTFDNSFSEVDKLPWKIENQTNHLENPILKIHQDEENDQSSIKMLSIPFNEECKDSTKANIPKMKSWTSFLSVNTNTKSRTKYSWLQNNLNSLTSSPKKTTNASSRISPSLSSKEMVSRTYRHLNVIPKMNHNTSFSNFETSQESPSKLSANIPKLNHSYTEVGKVISSKDDEDKAEVKNCVSAFSRQNLDKRHRTMYEALQKGMIFHFRNSKSWFILTK